MPKSVKEYQAAEMAVFFPAGPEELSAALASEIRAAGDALQAGRLTPDDIADHLLGLGLGIIRNREGDAAALSKLNTAAAMIRPHSNGQVAGDIDRAALTLAASPDLDTLKAEIARVIREIEEGRASTRDLSVSLVQLGLSIALALDGPTATMHGLSSALHQMANAYPEAFREVQAASKRGGHA